MSQQDTGNNGDGHEDSERNPRRFWPAIINAINSKAAYYRAKAHQRGDPESREMVRWTKATAKGTIIGAGLAGIAALAFWFQFGAMEDSNTEANRAWIAPFAAGPQGVNPDGTISYQVKFINDGRAPALQEAWKADAYEIPNPPNGDYSKVRLGRNPDCDGLKPTKEGGVTYGYVSPMDIPVHGVGGHVPLARQKDKSHSSYVRGCVAYWTMGVVGHSAFCFVFKPIVPNVAEYTMSCPTGNWAD